MQQPVGKYKTKQPTCARVVIFSSALIKNNLENVSAITLSNTKHKMPENAEYVETTTGS